jgi:hypothetical protein
MASWDQLRSYIHDNYKVMQDTGTHVQLGFDLGNGRTQIVYVVHRTTMAGRESWIHVESPFGKADRLDIGDALREVEGMLCGGISLVGDFLTLRHAVPLENLDVNEFERPLTLITGAADTLESKLSVGDTL